MRLFLWYVAFALIWLGNGMRGAGANETEGAKQALAGWATVEITPPLGIALGGRGGPITMATKVLDPLLAQIVYVKDAKGTGMVLASFDLIGLPHDLSDRLRTGLAQQLGVDWDLVVLNSSHTHSGPYMIRSLMAGVEPPPQVEVDYFDWLAERVTTAAREAAQRMQPVKVETFEGTSNLGINRRGKNKEGRRGIIPDPQGPIDQRIWVMKLTPEQGKPALVFSYACHPVIVYGYALAAISADFPGAARTTIAREIGAGTHAQFVQGFAGNIRPRITADLENNRFRASQPSDLIAAGQDLGENVLAALKKGGQELLLDLAGTSGHPFLPRGEPPPRKVYETLRTNALATTNKFQLAVSDYWLRRYDQKEGFARGDVWSLGLIRLAKNQWIVHSGGEPCVEWRTKIEAWLAPLRVVTFGYSQEAKSYLPTEALLAEGGYEVWESNQARASTPAPFAPGIEGAIQHDLSGQLAFIRAARR